MPYIFDYLDYREFLRDAYRERKQKEAFFSYRYIGNHVGMDSSYLIKVFQGHLHITLEKIPRFIAIFKFNDNEAEFFETLVYFGKAREERERKTYFDKLFAISKVKAHTLASHQYEFFSKWYYSAIWAIINCQSFKGTFSVLADQCAPPISAREAKEAVRLLERLGLIECKTDGAYFTTTANLTTGEKWHSQAIEHYQNEMVRLAGESNERFARNDRDMSTVTLTLPQKAFPEVQNIVSEFRKSLIKLANEYEKSDRVFQLNVQLFPLSEYLGGDQ